MSDDYLMIRIDTSKKEALRNRAFDLHIKGGMSELVMNLIDKELQQASQPSSTPSTTTVQQ